MCLEERLGAHGREKFNLKQAHPHSLGRVGGELGQTGGADGDIRVVITLSGSCAHRSLLSGGGDE